MWSSLDVGKQGCGVALWGADDILVWGKFVASGPAGDAASWFTQAVAVASVIGESLPPGVRLSAVVVETMRIYTFGHARPDDIINLQGLAGMNAGVIASLLGSNDVSVIGYEARTWKGQVKRDVMGNRVAAKVEKRGWSDRVLGRLTKTQKNDVYHAVGLGLYAVDQREIARMF